MRVKVPGRQKVSRSNRIRQTGAHCTRIDSRLGGGTPLADRVLFPCLSGPRNDSLVSQMRAPRHISKCEKS